MCHGDDIVAVGSRRWLNWLVKKVTDKFDIKSQMIGPRSTDKNSAQMLGRVVTIGLEGVQYEAGPGHAEIIAMPTASHRRPLLSAIGCQRVVIK